MDFIIEVEVRSNCNNVNIHKIGFQFLHILCKFEASSLICAQNNTKFIKGSLIYGNELSVRGLFC